MSWTPWKRAHDVWYKTKQEGGWLHMLFAHSSTTSDAERNRNHIHFKLNGDGAAVVCSVKVDGLHKVNRRELIESIKRRCPEIDLDYR